MEMPNLRQRDWPMKRDPTLQASLAALREPIDVRARSEIVSPTKPKSVDRLSLTVLWYRLKRIRERMDGLEQRLRDKEAEIDRLEHELAAEREEAARLRAGAEHAHEALSWGLDVCQGPARGQEEHSN